MISVRVNEIFNYLSSDRKKVSFASAACRWGGLRYRVSYVSATAKPIIIIAKVRQHRTVVKFVPGVPTRELSSFWRYIAQ